MDADLSGFVDKIIRERGNSSEKRGQEYGLCDSLRYLIADDITFPYLKEAIPLTDVALRDLLTRIMHGEIAGVTSPLKYAAGVERERICELETIISSVEKKQ